MLKERLVSTMVSIVAIVVFFSFIIGLALSIEWLEKKTSFIDRGFNFLEEHNMIVAFILAGMFVCWILYLLFKFFRWLLWEPYREWKQKKMDEGEN